MTHGKMLVLEGGKHLDCSYTLSKVLTSKEGHHQCKIAWDLVGQLIWQADTAKTAMKDKICVVNESQTSVINIITGLTTRDEKDGTLNSNFRI